jgi:hypothetical protein
MMQQLEELVARFERGHIDRRYFLGALAALTYSTIPSSSAATLPARHLTHVNIRVRDVKESERFYRELFGSPARPDGGGRSVRPRFARWRVYRFMSAQ